MAVYKSSQIKDTRYLLSQTPKNFVEDNYFLNELQEKVIADWPFRPNRKDIEEELVAGSEVYSDIEVVIQSVKNDKGESVSDDWYRLVFKDCRKVNRLGKRYRFSYAYNPYEADEDKNIWIGLNQTTFSPTSGQVVCRCNGTIGSIYVNDNGKTEYHYEPIIQQTKLNSSGFDYSEVAIDPDGSLVLIAQYNQYTKQYYINQRFVIGTSYVYKVTNIIKSDSETTYNPDDIGIMRIYLSMDQVGKLDDMDKRIAYNGREDDPSPVTEDDEYSLIIKSPSSIPNVIPSDGITIVPALMKNGEEVSGATISCTASIEGENAELVSVEDYCDIVKNSDNSVTVTRKKVAMNWNLKLLFKTSHDDTEISLGVIFTLRPF